jgi:serine/threonine-protein kinase
VSSLEQLRAALADRYTIERELGQGGMATVYLAEDLKHKRKVALKVLKPELAAVLGAERFVQEITTTAALQHPHILPLFDSGEAGGFLYYVMPFIDGETLRAKLDRETQLGVEEAVKITTAVADALDYAHRQGVVHRDIKPENILLHEGRPMVADFGIALAVSAAAGGRMTETGLSLGTPHYMSPEQATAEKEISGRSDVYSLASVLYEMLAGQPPHLGGSAQQIIMKIIAEDPAPLTKLRKSVPENVAAAVAKALEKLPADRFESARAFAEALGNTGFTVATGMASGVATVGVSPKAFAVVATFAAVTTVLLLASIFLRGGESAAPPAALAADITPPQNCAIIPRSQGGQSELSPDGTQLAMIAGCAGQVSLWLRSLANGAEWQVTGTNDASYPFWSPDGKHIGFFQGSRLKQINLASGLVLDLASAPNGRGGSWGPTDSIIYSPDLESGLFVVPAQGGSAVMRVAPITDGDAVWTHRTPYLLPTGQKVLFISKTISAGDDRLQVAEMGGGAPRLLLEGVSAANYAERHLFYVRDEILFAHPFDPEAAEFLGAPFPIVGGVRQATARSLGEFSVARTGRLTYQPLMPDQSRFAWLDLASGALYEALPPDEYGGSALSPDGRTIAVFRRDPTRTQTVLWLRDVEQDQWLRTTLEGVNGLEALIWSHDSRLIYINLYADRIVAVLARDGSRLPDLRSGAATRPLSAINRDGDVMLGERQVPETGWDIMRTTIAADSILQEPLLVRAENDLLPQISPDGRSYSTLYGDQRSVEVATMERPAATRIAWPSGARFHRWSHDGRTLYVLTNSGALMALPIGPALAVGTPVAVNGAPGNTIGVSTGPDRRLLLQLSGVTQQRPLKVFDHWRAAIGTR